MQRDGDEEHADEHAPVADHSSPFALSGGGAGLFGAEHLPALTRSYQAGLTSCRIATPRSYCVCASIQLGSSLRNATARRMKVFQSRPIVGSFSVPLLNENTPDLTQSPSDCEIALVCAATSFWTAATSSGVAKSTAAPR